jgi:hypothetical protein
MYLHNIQIKKHIQIDNMHITYLYIIYTYINGKYSIQEKLKN